MVSLSSSGKVRVSIAASDTKSKSDLSNQGTLSTPKPTGPYTVGTRILELTDATRVDPYAADGSKRDLLVRLWYPASPQQTCIPAEYASTKVWSYFAELVGVTPPKVITNSCQDAPVSADHHPTVIFTPGYTATFTDYTFLFEDLASRGYVVASIDHTYEATAVEFPDGRLVKSVLGSHLLGTERGDDQTLALAAQVRVRDVESVLDELRRQNDQSASPFAGRLDMARVSLAGHSLGGLTALLTVQEDARFNAAVVLDGVLPVGLVKTTQTPTLLITGGSGTWYDDLCNVWNKLNGQRQVVNLVGADHLTPSDLAWLTPNAVKAGSAGPENAMSAVRESTASFLDAAVRGSTPESWKGVGAINYSGVTVVTQNTPQCTKP
jgi:pimeloyl-ACP methyl ester carboxylesterase